eukprot:5257509-Karenia_brevis.AAC.1
MSKRRKASKTASGRFRNGTGTSAGCGAGYPIPWRQYLHFCTYGCKRLGCRTCPGRNFCGSKRLHCEQRHQDL